MAKLSNNIIVQRLTGQLSLNHGDFLCESVGKGVEVLNSYSPVVEYDVKYGLIPEILKEAGAKSVKIIDPEKLAGKTTCTKLKMAKWIDELSKSLNFANELLKVANSTISKLQCVAIEDKETIIKLKDEVISNKNEQLKSVSTTVQSEMKTYADLFKKSCKKATVTQEKLTKAIKTVAEEEDRGKNLMIFGLAEEKGECLSDKLDEIFTSIGEKPCIVDCVRVGATNSDKEKPAVRPVKVITKSSDTVHQLLRKSGRLRISENYKSVYFSPDRTLEERATHQQLVLQMKEKIKNDSKNYHFIKNGTVMSKPRE